MAIFQNAVEILLAQEGGYTVDTGGPTNFGITVPVLQEASKSVAGLDVDNDGDIDADDIRKMQRVTAELVYKKQWWDRYGYSLIREQEIANRVLSFSVNMGPKQGHKIIQRAVRACGYYVKDDGWIGPVTLSHLNSVETKMLIVGIRSESAGFYRALAMKNDKYVRYLEGWLNRAYA